MDSFFGTPWHDLDLAAVGRFLTHDAEAEGLTWEAKGTDPRGGGDRPHRDAVRKNVSAFANSELGGFYILGAAREQRNAGSWRLDPLDFQGEEPTAWLSRVVRGGVNPLPFYDIHEWELDGRHVAVLRVDPVGEPPCITMSGEVFTRVSGESIPVTNPETLRRLYERGEERVQRSIRNARYAGKPERDGLAGRGYGVGLGEPAELRLRVAFAPVGVDESTETRVLRRSFATLVVEAAHALPPSPLFPYSPHSDFLMNTSRTSTVVSETTETNRQRWKIEIETDATVTVSLNVQLDGAADAVLHASAVVEDALRPAVQTATHLARDAGAYGRGYLVVSAVGRDFELLAEGNRRGDLPAIPNPMPLAGHGPREYRDGLEAWVDVGEEPSGVLLAALERELLRTCGITAWEPEPVSGNEGEE